MQLKQTLLDVTMLCLVLGLAMTAWAEVGGYLQIRYTTDWGAVDGFGVKRARIKLSGETTPYTTYAFLMDMATLLDGGTVKGIVQDAYVDLSYLPRARIRVGQFKVPFSPQYLISSTRWKTIELSQVVKEEVGNRDIGVQVSGTLPHLNYTLGLFNGEGGNKVDTNDQVDLVGRLVAEPLRGLQLGVAHYQGKSGGTEADKVRTGGQVSLLRENIFLLGEYMVGKDGSTKIEGWYVQLSHCVVPPLEGVLMYDRYDPNAELPNNALYTITLGANWYVDRKLKLMVNYRLRDSEAQNIGDQILTQLQVIF